MFSWWNNTCWNTVTSDCTITSDFVRVENEHLVVFENDDWTVLQSWMMLYWETPLYTWETPTKDADAQYTYSFRWWSPTISSVVTWETYTAIYDKIVNQYTATISVNSGNYGTVSSGLVISDYWTSISISWNQLTIWDTTIIAEPAESGAQYTYTFSWWTNTCWDSLTWNCTITANFDRTTNQYELTLNAWTGVESVSWAWTYNYGSWVTISAICNTSSGYVFSWWIKNSWDTPSSLTTTPTIVTITQDTELTAVCRDNKKPVWSLTTTAEEKQTVQRLTWTCTDEVWVIAYYFGTHPSPSNSSYITISSTTSFTTWMDITTTWTYYLYCKDAAWNVSTSVSEVYYVYTVQNMIDKIEWTTWVYDTINYEATWSLQWPYLIPHGVVISLNNSTLYWHALNNSDSPSHYTIGWTNSSNTPSITTDGAE